MGPGERDGARAVGPGVVHVSALAAEEVLRLGVKLAGALETAHRAGILHRDIKPANILYTDFGEPAYGVLVDKDGNCWFTYVPE